MVTNVGSDSVVRAEIRRSRGRKKQGPFLKVKAGSAVVPIYQTESKNRLHLKVSRILASERGCNPLLLSAGSGFGVSFSVYLVV